jgi:hypothetical protein
VHTLTNPRSATARRKSRTPCGSSSTRTKRKVAEANRSVTSIDCQALDRSSIACDHLPPTGLDSASTWYTLNLHRRRPRLSGSRLWFMRIAVRYIECIHILRPRSIAHALLALLSTCPPGSRVSTANTRTERERALHSPVQTSHLHVFMLLRVYAAQTAMIATATMPDLDVFVFGSAVRRRVQKQEGSWLRSRQSWIVASLKSLANAPRLSVQPGISRWTLLASAPHFKLRRHCTLSLAVILLPAVHASHLHHGHGC